MYKKKVKVFTFTFTCIVVEILKPYALARQIR